MLVTRVRFEHHEDALGVGTAAPRLSWQVRTDDPGWAQTAYEVELCRCVLGGKECLEPNGHTVVRVDSAEQVLVAWPFAPLASRTRAAVRIRVAAGERWSEWSAPSTVETGLLAGDDWSARFVAPARIGGIGERAPILGRTFTPRGAVASARLYVTAHGVYSVTLNGVRVGDEVLAPGWTSYPHRLRYQTHDVTAALKPGENTLEALLGNGWYRGRLGWTGNRGVYGDRVALLAQLEIAYADGTSEVIGTDERWIARESGVLDNDLYDGQHTDLRTHRSVVDGVEVVEADLSTLVSPDGPPVRVTEVVPAVSVSTSPSGRTLVDFGQNLVGWVRLKVGKTVAGQEIVVRHAEVLEHGELGVRPLRGAKATDTYVLADADDVVLEPSLTFHGFRYAEVTGVPELAPADVEAVVIGSDLRRTGWFGCSDPTLERFHENVVWSMRGNFLDLPTDCPQRDERLGWTGDIQVFAPTASFLYDTAGFLGSWLADLAAEQHEDGSVPFVIPDVLSDVLSIETPAATAWGDAATIVPWVLYRHYGDVEILARQFASMRAWVDRITAVSTDGLWVGGFQFGDWLDPSAPPDDPFAAKADPDVVATAYLARSAQIVADTAELLGKTEEAKDYGALAERTRAAFANEYVTAAGRVLSDAQTVYALALEFALLPTAGQRRKAGERLADLVRGNGFRIGTGFVGTPLIADALTSAGIPDLAYRLLLERGCPSWLYPVTMGATTIWERWDSMLPDGTINPGQMTSFNHYALGAVADWMHRTVAGLAPGAPGYREIVVRPVPDAALAHAWARHETPYGEAYAGWHRADGKFVLDVEIPPGTTATVHSPAGERIAVGPGRHTWTWADPCVPGERAVKTVRDVIDASELWAEVVDVLVEHGLGTDAADIARRSAPYLDAEPAELPVFLARKDIGGKGSQAKAILAELLG
ncbi:family 78 glycoside hydrolase catalytic domain [Amycolatopsis sp. NPDC059027]|uniref:family 78 glycoside hydrolase catalytic domain n=1 Tax=Amycolatopsis sp. NPDC059027 TaxID=3346709 RepID=UPI00366AEF02